MPVTSIYRPRTRKKWKEKGKKGGREGAKAICQNEPMRKGTRVPNIEAWDSSYRVSFIFFLVLLFHLLVVVVIVVFIVAVFFVGHISASLSFDLLM